MADNETGNELLDYIYNKDSLRTEIDDYLEDGCKIDAIKSLQHEVLTYHKSRNIRGSHSLKYIRNAIDTYYRRFLLGKKLQKLSKRIEDWATTNNWTHPKYYDKIEFQPNQNLHGDWKLVDEHIGFVFDKLHWNPSHSEYKEYNKLWRKYKCP